MSERKKAPLLHGIQFFGPFADEVGSGLVVLVGEEGFGTAAEFGDLSGRFLLRRLPLQQSTDTEFSKKRGSRFILFEFRESDLNQRMTRTPGKGSIQFGLQRSRPDQ